jgi:hypothetical protein
VGDPLTEEYSDKEGREELAVDGRIMAFAAVEFGDIGLGTGLVLGVDKWWAFLSLLVDELGFAPSPPTPLESI